MRFTLSTLPVPFTCSGVFRTTWNATLLVISTVGLFAEPASRRVDFRYGLHTWHQPLGVPEDWHKPMANERGALLYDFGPGPYVKALTSIEASIAGAPFTLDRQSFVDNARIPAVRSRLVRGNDTVTVTTLSLPPLKPSPSVGDGNGWRRLDGIAGVTGWAAPAEGFSPEFRNVAWDIVANEIGKCLA